MSNRILVKVSVQKHNIVFRTITRKEKSPHSFYVRWDDLERMEKDGTQIVTDCGSFAVLRYDKVRQRISVQFSWLSKNGDSLVGRREDIHLSYIALKAFIEENGSDPAVTQWKTLSIEVSKNPRLVFCGTSNLREVVADKKIRRKLSRFLRDHFKWEKTEKICFYDDSLPYSFYFKEFSAGQPGLCGGLILHGQDNMETAYYAIHT